jgi:hypothetical protein
MYWIVFFGLIIFVISLALNASYVFRYIWVDKSSRIRRVVRFSSGLILSMLVLLLLVELFFTFFAKPDPYIHTLAAQNWFKRYWSLNSFGYRDIEWTPEQLAGRTKIMVLGDSIVAGHGIQNEEERFADRLGQMLGQDYAVLNVGLHGAGTRGQLDAALEYPFTPDVIILSFHVDDIVDTATTIGVLRPNYVPTSPRLVEESYAANYLYWHHYQPAPWPWVRRYQGWARGLYEDPGVWETYRSLLLDIKNFAEAQNIQLLVVAFPDLQNIEESHPIISQIGDLYREQNVPVLDVTELLEGNDSQTLTVSTIDEHPNERLHQLVAEELYRIIREAD